MPEIESRPESALVFHRDWISQNRPVIFRNALSDWPALEKWQDSHYLLEKLNKRTVQVAVTPDGYADSINSDANLFVMPYEESMSFRDFIEKLDHPIDSKVYYIQRQNSNLLEEMSELNSDIHELSWASEAFGKTPDAVNFWMGDGRAVTSTHKDPYENIYGVIKGHKDITLFPPTDLPWLRYKLCTQAVYNEKLEVETKEESTPIPWIAVDPLKPDLEKYPEYKNAHPLKLRLNAGDVLYLPSLWFHHLRQSHGCIAVNFWYDMEFDVKFNHYNLVQNLTKYLNKS